MRLRLTPSLFSAMIIIALAAVGSAQERTRQNPEDKLRQYRVGQKPTPDKSDKAAQAATQPEAPVTSDQAMLRAIVNLSTQITALTTEVKLLRKTTDRNSQTIELLLYEERLAKVEEKLDAAIERKSDLDSREQDIQRRLRNIQQEVMLRGGLRRDEVEAALRAEYQRSLEDIKNQQTLIQQRISELQTQATRLRVRVETLRKKIERAEEQSENANQ